MMHSTPERPASLHGDLANLPDALARLKALPNWVCWKWEWRVDKKGIGKRTKPPMRPSNPQNNANIADARTWGTYEQALGAYQKGLCDGIGFCLTNTDIAAFDLDNCRNPATGDILPEAMKLVARASSYTEITPSGTGLRIIGTGSGEKVHKKQQVPGSAMTVETYRKATRYITITGNPLRNTPQRMGNMDLVIDEVVAELGGVKAIGGVKASGGESHTLEEIEADLERLRSQRWDNGWHETMCIATASFMARGMNYDEACEKLAPFCDGGADDPDMIELLDSAWRKFHPEAQQGGVARLRMALRDALAPSAKEETAQQPAELRKSALEFFENFGKASPKRAIIKGVLYKGERSSWVGPPGSGKSALLADLAIHAAEGTDWRGHRCKEKVAVVYFALERKELVKRRMRAHAKPETAFEMKDGGLAPREVKAGFKNLPIALAGKAIDLLNRSCIEIMVENIRAAEAHYGCPVGLIIIDTYNKGIAMGGGEENAAKDQNIMAANLQQVQDQTDLHIALIGHTGKDESRGARGSNAHLGDVDMMVQISVDGTVRTATIIKINDGMEGILTRFCVEPVTLGRDEDGDPITTAIVSEGVPMGGMAGLSRPQQRAMAMLVVALAKGGEPAPPSGKYPKNVRVVTMEQWRDHCHRGGLSPTGTDAAKRMAFKRAASELIALGRIDVWDERVWIVP
jgi:hypothetical protein